MRAGNQFRRDLRKVEKQGRDMAKLRTLIDLLLSEQALPVRYKDHALRGNWAGHRDAHIEPDWVLIYRVSDGLLWLYRTGSHAELFG